MDNKPMILACDPSFTAWGWAILQNHTIIDSGCIRTAPEDKRRRIRKGDDRVRRLEEIAQQLIHMIGAYHVEFIVSELPHGSKSATAAITIGAVAGLLVGLSQAGNIPLEWFSEGDAKRALLGRNSASKEEVIREIEATFESRLTGPKYRREAVADALAIYNVAQATSTTLKILTR